MLYNIALILFLLVCIIMTVAILLQASKGGGLAGAFGGGASMGTVFGGRGAGNFLSKATTWLAIIYLGVALMLSKLQADETAVSGQSITSQKLGEINDGAFLPPADPSISAVGSLLDSSSTDTATAVKDSMSNPE